MNAKKKPAADLVEQVEVEEVAGQIQTLEPAQPSTALASVDRLLELAVTGNADMAKLEKLLELKERYDKEEARKAFTAAMAAFKAEAIVIKKDKKVGFDHKDGQGKTEYWHATIGNVVNVAAPVMAKHGLSHRWDRKRENDRINVRCIVTHKDGHSEATDWWDAPLDDSGKKNPIQQGASTTSYLERYTFLLVTGLAVEEQDDDGASAGDEPPPERISEEQANEIHSKITDNGLDMDIFLGWLKRSQKISSIEDIPVALFDYVMGKVDESIKKKAKQ